MDIKVAQELMRHSSCRTTLDVYTRAVDQRKREANEKVVELMFPLELEKLQTASKMHSSIRQGRRSPIHLGTETQSEFAPTL